MLNKEQNKKIKTFGEALVNKLQAALPRATGSTANSIRLEVTQTGFIIYGAEHIDNIFFGRKPTSAGAKKGNPTVQEMIYEWIKAKSIAPKESSMSQEALSWAISKSIHKKGYKGKGDLFKDILKPKNFSSLADELLNIETINLQRSIRKQIKK